MHGRWWWAGVLAAGLAVGAPRADGQDMSPEPEPEAFDLAEIFAFTDLDKDGIVTLAEVRKRNEELGQALEAAGDDEAAIEDVFRRFQHVLDIFTFLGADRDDDHALSFAELERAFAAPDGFVLSDKDYELLAQDEAALVWPLLLAQYDNDADGKLTRAEVASASPEADEFTAEVVKAFAQVDANADGAIDEAEMVAHLARMLRVELEAAEHGADLEAPEAPAVPEAPEAPAPPAAPPPPGE